MEMIEIQILPLPLATANHPGARLSTRLESQMAAVMSLRPAGRNIRFAYFMEGAQFDSRHVRCDWFMCSFIVMFIRAMGVEEIGQSRV